MMKKVITYLAATVLAALVALPSSAQDTTIVMGQELARKDTTKQSRFTNRLIAPKGEWQCGLSIMYLDFNSDNSDYMLLLQGLNANASMFKITPEAAYTFRNNHAVGVKFNYSKFNGMLDSATADLLGNLSLSVGDINAITNSMGGSLYQRTYVGIDKLGRFGIFWDYIVGYSRAKTQLATGSDAHTLKNMVKLAFAPGVVYFPMNNISVQANVSIADLSYAQTKSYLDGIHVGTHMGWKAQAGLNILNLSFGLTIHL